MTLVDRVRTLLWIGLPVAVLAAAMLVFVFCFTSFGVILILGGPRLATIEVEIWRQATGLVNFEVAAALAFLVVQMLFVPCVATVAAVKQVRRVSAIALSIV